VARDIERVVLAFCGGDVRRDFFDAA
jgi:hypothetical protein